MTTPNDPPEENFESATSQLDQGLRSCRAVLSGYRALLGETGDGPADATFPSPDFERRDADSFAAN